jgi:hypothetical protein
MAGRIKLVLYVSTMTLEHFAMTPMKLSQVVSTEQGGNTTAHNLEPQ